MAHVSKIVYLSAIGFGLGVALPSDGKRNIAEQTINSQELWYSKVKLTSASFLGNLCRSRGEVF